MAVPKIQATKNYSLFTREEGGNRPFNLKKHRGLERSMKKYGFLKSFPIVVRRDAKGHLVVKDGQHRLAIAQALDLTVYWVEDDGEWDVAVVNSAAEKWTIRDYAETYAFNGLDDYKQGLEFADTHNLPVGTAFALLAGTTSFTNIRDEFHDGMFEVKDRPWADVVAVVYGGITAVQSSLRKNTFVDACMAVSRVPGFDAKRLIQGASKCPERLINYATRDGFLDMLQELYNYQRKQQVPLKFAALEAMKERNVSTKWAKDVS